MLFCRFSHFGRFLYQSHLSFPETSPFNLPGFRASALFATGNFNRLGHTFPAFWLIFPVLAVCTICAAQTVDGQPVDVADHVALSPEEPSVQVVDSRRMRTYRNIPYVRSGGERQQLDLYLPNRNGLLPTADQPVPVIVWIHWGSWDRGSKEPCLPVGLGYCQKGYALAAINYRLTRTNPFPAQLEDCKSAIRWLRAHAAEYGLDGDRIGAWGVSAGGHLAALLGTTGDTRDFDVGEHLDRSSEVRCVCELFGPADLESFLKDPELETFLQQEDKAIRRFLGGDPREKLDLAYRASPTFHVDAASVPFLIVHGDKDPLVPVSQSERLFEKLQKAGVESELVVVKNGVHGPAGFLNGKMLRKYEEFFAKHLKP